MLHTGSRGLGHQVATDALVAMEKVSELFWSSVRSTKIVLESFVNVQNLNFRDGGVSFNGLKGSVLKIL